MIDWSWRLLSPVEQELFARLSVFPASWDVAAAHAVCAPSAAPGATARSLGRLLDTSLLIVDRSGPGTRYRMLEAVAEFARLKAGQAGITKDLHARHFQHYAQVARELAATARAPGAHDTVRRFCQEWDNLRAALGWALDARDLDAAVALVAGAGVWALPAMRSEHAGWTSRTLRLASELDRPDASLCVTAAEWAYWSDQRADALRLATEAVRLAPERSAEAAAAWVRVVYTKARLDEFDTAAAALTQAERALERCEDRFTFVTGHAILHGIIGILRPERRASHLRMVRRAAADFDNALINAVVGRTIVSDLLFSGATEDAIAEARPALAAARDAGAAGLEADLMVLSLAPLAHGGKQAPQQLRDMVARLKYSGYRQLADVALETLAMFWACNARTGLAGLVLGYLQAQGPLYQHPYWVRLRAETLDPIRDDPQAAPYLARGAAMNQRQVLELVLDELATGQPSGSAATPDDPVTR